MSAASQVAPVNRAEIVVDGPLPGTTIVVCERVDTPNSDRFAAWFFGPRYQHAPRQTLAFIFGEKIGVVHADDGSVNLWIDAGCIQLGSIGCAHAIAAGIRIDFLREGATT